MYTYIWIEGFERLTQFCRQRFPNDRIEWMDGTVGRIGVGCKVYQQYKERPDGSWAEMYLLSLPVSDNDAATKRIPNLVTGTELFDKVRHGMTYDQIRADGTAIVRR